MKQSINKIIFLLLYLIPVVVAAQSIKDVRINEIQVFNSNSLRDEYGRSVPWIELANRGHNKVNVAGCYLKVNEKEYRIPYNDPKTVIPTQGYLIFYAGGDPDKGTFHTNLRLDSANLIEFYDTDGNLIDALRFNPEQMLDNVSYGWISDDHGKEKLMNLPALTPGASNNTLEKTSRAETFRQSDPSGLILTITAITVVAVVLVMLFFIFKIMGYYHVRAEKKQENKAKKSIKNPVEISPGQKETITPEEIAALAVALHKYYEDLHNAETNILTIKHVDRAYSHWNSKTYGLTKKPKKR